MKFFSILHKDFKLLLRSKSSAFTVFIGPILIIALILFAFSSSEEISFSIGIVDIDAADASTQEFLSGLETEGYMLVQYTLLESCVEDMKSSKVNLCLDFPTEGIVVEEIDPVTNETITNSKKQITFYVDQSRINVVESIILSVGANIKGKSEEMADEKTGDILTQIAQKITAIKTAQETSSSLVESTLDNDATAIKASANSIVSDVNDVIDDLDSATDDASDSESEIEAIDDEFSALIDDLDILMAELDDMSLNGTAETAYDDIDTQLDGSIEDNIEDLNNLIDSLNDDINSASNSLEDVDSSTSAILSKINSVEIVISELTEQLDTIDSEAISIAALTGQSFENEYEININEIVSSSDKSLFMFPYYLVLLILFVGMMLASTLVVIERQSMAFFRNYTSPTSYLMHLVARFTANASILAIQVGVVLCAVYFYLNIPIFENYKVTLVILFLTISLFVFLGYLMGYIFKTQEGITIAFISFGAICAFLSNLILPIETFSYTIRSVLMYNPYMLCSELLKKSIVFNSGFVALGPELMTLIGYLIFVIILVLIFQKLSLSRFSFSIGTRGVLKRPHINSDKHFVLEDGTIVEDIASMALALNDMNTEEYIEYGSGKASEIALWITDVFGERRLSWRIRKAKTKADVVKVLNDFVEKKRKK